MDAKSVLTDSPASGYVLAQWAVQYAIHNRYEFVDFLSVGSELPPGSINADTILNDLETTKSLLGSLAIMTDDLVNKGQLEYHGEHVHVSIVIPDLEQDSINKIITDGINPLGT